MKQSSKRIRAHISACLLAGAGLVGSAHAAIVYSGPVNIVIPDSADGLYLNVVTGATSTAVPPPAGWDINPYSALAGQFTLWGPTAQTWLSTSAAVAGPYPLAPGTLVQGAATAFFRPGQGTNVGTQVTLNSSDNLLGFRFLNETTSGNHFGWVRIQFGATAGVRTIVGYAYENVADTAIAAGATGIANTAPTIAAQAVARVAGSAPATLPIATVTDAEGAGASTVTVNGGASATVNGVTVGSIVNTAGAITANVAVTCTATTAAFTLRATDAGALFAESTLNVTVSANTPPTLAYPASSNVPFGGSTAVPPTAVPGDNGSIATIVLQDAGTYAGAAAVNNVSGVVSLSNAAGVGAHLLVVRATDNCGAFTDAGISLTVDPGNTVTTITSDTPDPSNLGAPVTVSFTVAPVAPATEPVSTSSNVMVTDGTSSCSATIAVGQCVLTPATAGSITLTATFAGNASYLGSSDTEGHTVVNAADLSILKTVDTSALGAGTVGYSILVSNTGPSDVVDATVADTFAAPQTNAEWTCVGSDGGVCDASGTGNINTLVDLPAGASVEFAVVADVPVPLDAAFSNTATVTAPAGVTEIDTDNNTSTVDVLLSLIFADGFEEPSAP